MKITKSSRLNIKYANVGKLDNLNEFMQEQSRCIQFYVDKFIADEGLIKAYPDEILFETWLSKRAVRCAIQQAKGIAKSWKTKKEQVEWYNANKAGKEYIDKKGIKHINQEKHVSKPIFNGKGIILNANCCEIFLETDTKEYDMWIKLKCLGKKLKIVIPTKKHKHFNKLVAEDYNLSKSIVLCRESTGKYYVNVSFEKESVEKRVGRKVIGVDCGKRKLIATSNGHIYGEELDEVYGKLTRRKRGSKNYKQTLQERDNIIGKVVNEMMAVEQPDIIVLEALKNVKHGTRQTNSLSRATMNQLQYWKYPKALDLIKRKCAERGISVVDVPPAYTSQTCSKCGHIEKANRVGSQFRCCSCGYELDADINAAINIRNRGIYSFSNTKSVNRDICNKC